jgi:hypothetical protein
MDESKKEVFNLFYPWFYQGEMMSDIENYISALKKGDDTLKSNKQELIRLYKDFSNIDLTDKAFLLHIGANCNHYKGGEPGKLYDCKSRLIPDFFNTSSINQNSIIFIVDNFGDDTDISKLSTSNMPIEKTDDQNKYTVDNNGIKITIYVYNTYFPTYLDENKYYTKNKETTQFIREKTHRSDDKRFVTEFYNKLSVFLSKSLFSVILSTASFLSPSATQKYVLNEYGVIDGGFKRELGTGNVDLELYPEIINIIKDPKIIFIMWPFESEYFYILKHLAKFKYIVPGILYIDKNPDTNQFEIYGNRDIEENIVDFTIFENIVNFKLFREYFREEFEKNRGRKKRVSKILKM